VLSHAERVVAVSGLRVVGVAIATVITAACVSGDVVRPAQVGVADARIPEPVSDVLPAPPAPSPTPAPQGPRYSKLRVFVASESTNSVWVLEAAPDKPYEVIGKIAVGVFPHQMGTSPDGRWIAVNNRMANTTSVIDAVAMKAVARLGVGRQPHAIGWSPDSQTLFVGHERDMYIARFEAETWKPLPALMVGVPQHVLTIARGRPNEVWFTLTNTGESDVLRMYDLATKQITRVKVGDVHDAFFTPDESELWSSSSGFVDKPSDRMVIYDPDKRTVKAEVHFPGHYPFHTIKVDQDGAFFLGDTSVMLLSDHALPGLVWVDWRERRIVGETRLGKQPFHTIYDPEGARVLTTTNGDGMVNVIDVRTREVVQKIAVPKPHGIGAVGIP
jgi:DNA-binding beta-propeller fold protein YncE